MYFNHEWPGSEFIITVKEKAHNSETILQGEIRAGLLGARPLLYLMNTLKPKYWYSAHLHISFDAIKKFPNGSTTRFTALDKSVGNRDHLRVKLKQSLFCS